MTMGAVFVSIYNFFEAHRKVYFFLLLSIFAGLAFLASGIHLEEDISKALPKDKKIEKLNEVFQNSKFLDKLAISVSLADTTLPTEPDSLVAFATRLNEDLEESVKPYIRKITFRVDDQVVLDLFSTIRRHLPVFLNEADYLLIDSLIEPEQLRASFEQNYRTLSSPAGMVMKDMIRHDPVGITAPAMKRLQRLQVDDQFEVYDNCILTKDQKSLIMVITPAFPPDQSDLNAQFIARLDSVLQVLHAEHDGKISARYFGASAVSVGNAIQLRKDAMYTQGITVLFLILFIGFYFRKKRAPLLVLLPVAFGALFSIACIYLLKGKISIIALGTGSIVFGIAVNYSLHLFNHYRHRRDIREVLRDLAMPMTIGSFTTVGGFLCLQFVKSEMLRDLGLFTAFSLIGASLFSLIFLPHLIVSKEDKATHLPTHSWIDKLSSFSLEHNKKLILLIVLVTIGLSYTARKVGFEADMMKMNYMSDSLRESEAEFNRMNAFALQSVYLVSEGKDLDEALAANEKILDRIDELQSKGIVKKFSGVSSLLISDSLQQARIQRWNEYWTPAKKQLLLSNVDNEAAALKFTPTAFLPFHDLMNASYAPMAISDLGAIRENFLEDYITEAPEKTTVVEMLKVAPGMKQEVYKAFENNPELTIIDKQYLTSKFVEIIQSDFSRIALFTSILVFVVLLLTYGRIELAIVTFVPMLITWIWILGLMGIMGLQFNIINIILSALIFGLGDDYSLFIMDGLLQEYKTGKKNLTSYKSSIILSAITTILGLGVLIFAKHPALQSIALISIIGISCVVLISFILIPFLFHLLITKRTNAGRAPWTLHKIVVSIIGFFAFFLGSLLLTVLGFFIVKLNLFGKERSKIVYHHLMAGFAWMIVRVVANIKVKVINPLNERLDKPAILICNHMSFFDLLSTVMLFPKCVLLTNDWVWNSPVFGAVVRMADYYPVTEGAINSINHLQDRVNHGYSILIFPEGTRSPDGVIKRFHKGAFYLSEQLQIDIIPLLIHGTGYVMGKGEYQFKRGDITLKYLPRITPQDNTFGTNYTERAKLVGRYFRAEYDVLRRQVEQPEYFREQLLSNYIYKGPIVEWYLRVKVKLEDNYRLFHQHLPLQGHILDIGCGYGFMSYMLKYLSPQREIYAVDYDESKTDLAQHNYGRPEGLEFAHADITSFDFKSYDGIVLADVLHYLKPEQQKETIISCFKSLNPGGIMMIRDGNRDLTERHKGTKLTEFLSTKVFSFNKTTTSGLSFLSGAMIHELAAKYQLTCDELDNSSLTSNIIFILKKNS